EGVHAIAGGHVALCAVVYESLHAATEWCEVDGHARHGAGRKRAGSNFDGQQDGSAGGNGPGERGAEPARADAEGALGRWRIGYEIRGVVIRADDAAVERTRRLRVRP